MGWTSATHLAQPRPEVVRTGAGAQLSASRPSRSPYLGHAWLGEDVFSDPGTCRAEFGGVPAAMLAMLHRRLLAEQNAAFYSRSGDGAWVLNLVIRTSGQLLRICTRPQSTEQVSIAAEVFRHTLAAEAPSSSGERAGRDRATGVMDRLLSARGYDQAASWFAAVLSAELDAWLQNPAFAQVPMQATGTLATVLRSLRGLREDAEALVGMLPEYGAFAALLERAEQDSVVTRTILPALAQAAASVVGSDPEHGVLTNTGSALQKLAQRVDPDLAEITSVLAVLRHQVERVRCAAVAAHVVGEALARETEARVEACRWVVDADLAALVRAAEHATSEMAVEAASLAEDLNPVAEHCAVVLARLGEFHRWVGRYRLLVAKLPDADHLKDLAEALDRQLEASDKGPLNHVKASCEVLPVVLPVESVLGHLNGLRAVPA